MASFRLSTMFLLALLSVHVALRADPTQAAPSPAPAPASNAASPPPANPSPTPTPTPTPTPSPSPSAGSSSSPAPSPRGHAPDSSPSPSGTVTSRSGVSPVGEGKKSSGGLTSGQKAGIAIGVIAALGVVVVGAIVYRKRQQNIRRSQYGYAARRELL
ncbi:hypothetical protein NMG60_11033162 [Bertholletia excelsa]